MEWFKNFNWIGLNNGTLKAPIIPNISSNEDASNFENWDNNDDESSSGFDDDYQNDGTNWDKDF